MKRVVFLLALLGAFSINAQNVKYGGWNEQIEVGAFASVNSTWLLNSAVSSLDDGVSDIEFTFGWSVAGSGAFRFNQLIAVGLHFEYFNANQNYSGVMPVTATAYESKVNVTGVNLPIYAKIMSKGGAFVEIGWQFGFITGANYSRFGTTVGSNIDNKDIGTSFSTAVFSPHLAFGIDFPIGDELIITAGIRANYGVNDIGGVDGLSNDVAKYPTAATPISPADTPPAPTNLLTGGIFLGARYLFDAGGRY